MYMCRVWWRTEGASRLSSNCLFRVNDIRLITVLPLSFYCFCHGPVHSHRSPDFSHDLTFRFPWSGGTATGHVTFSHVCIVPKGGLWFLSLNHNYDSLGHFSLNCLRPGD